MESDQAKLKVRHNVDPICENRRHEEGPQHLLEFTFWLKYHEEINRIYSSVPIVLNLIIQKYFSL